MLEDEADLWDSWIARSGLEEKREIRAAAAGGVTVDIMMPSGLAS
jgi:hypothetical protein